jgi:hypothetical protein
MAFLKTEYIEDTIRRCAQIEPDEFRELLNGLLAEIDWAVHTQSSNTASYDSGTWNWYMVRLKCKRVNELLEAAGFNWTPVPKRTPEEIAKMWEALGSDDATPGQTEPQQAQDT